jgi:glycine dehydrogenase subunit 2
MSKRKSISTFPEISEPVLKFISACGKNKRTVPQPFGQGIPGDLADMASSGLPEIPDVAEVETVRHFTRLSRKNFGVDQGMYPLGSCTMKYNPKISEVIAQTIADKHPGDKFAMSNVLRALAALKRYLEEICGMEGCCLWPAAGAHGELTGMLIIKKAIISKGEKRPVVLIPDTAHGTNPASCAIAGFQIKNIPSGPSGYLEAKTLKEHITPDVAALMITNPNTLGIFEQEIKEIADLLHANGSYLYMDGANLNAIMGIARPGDMGVDCMHVNLHKTFSTPHGGGGPGAGPVLVTEELEKFLPVPGIVHEPHKPFVLSYDAPLSIGMVHSFLGNVGVLIRALVYIVSIGPKGIFETSRTAALNANYLKKKLSGIFDLPYDTPTLHEFVLSDKNQKESHVTTMDMAKALMDYGFHPPTVYFPLVVPGAIMIEPTETEPLTELDRFSSAMEEIAGLAKTDPESFHDRPLMTPVARVDEVKAARSLILSWNEMESNTL